MFAIPRKRAFGQFDWIASVAVPVLTTGLNVGGQYLTASLASSTAKSIASQQSETSLGVASIQERIAQLKLQEVQAQTQAAVQVAQIQASTSPLSPVTSVVSKVVGGNIAGIPAWMALVVIGGGAFLFLRKKS